MSIPDTTTIETEIRAFLTDNFPLSAGFDYAASDSLIGVGAIDSTGVLELIEHLEGHYGVEVPDSEVLPENLDSIENIARYVHSKQSA